MISVPVQDAYIAVIGVKGAGKSSFISSCAEKRPKRGYDAETHTTEIEVHDFMYGDDIRVHLIDTPGFNGDGGKEDVQTLREIVGYLMAMFKEGKQLNGIICLHPLALQKSPGPSFMNVLMFTKLYANTSYGSVALVTSKWSDVGPDEGLRRERMLVGSDEFFSFMSEGGSGVFQYTDTRESALNIVSHLLSSADGIVLDQTKSGRGAHESPFGSFGGEIVKRTPMLSQLAKFMQEIGHREKEVAEIYQNQVRELLREIEAGAERQQALTRDLQEVIEYGDREFDSLQKRIDDLETELEKERHQHVHERELRLQYEKDLVEERLRHKKEREFQADECKKHHEEREAALELLRATMTADHEAQLEAAGAEATHRVEEREKAIRKEMGDEVEKWKLTLQKERDNAAEDIRRLEKENERQRQEDASKALEENKRRELDLKTSLQEQINQLKIDLERKHKDEVERVKKENEKREREVEAAVMAMIAENRRQHQEAMKMVQNEAAQWKKQIQQWEEREKAANFQKDTARWWTSRRKTFPSDAKAAG